MAIHERAVGPEDFFDAAYWGPLDKAVQAFEPPLYRSEKVNITDGRTINETALDFETLEKSNRQPDFELPIGQSVLSYGLGKEFNNAMVRFDRERLVVVGNRDPGVANVLAETWKITQPNLITVDNDCHPHGFFESEYDTHWAYRYESQVGIGVILPTTYGLYSTFGIRQEVKKIPEKLKAIGGPGHVQGIREAPREEINNVFVSLQMPTQFPASLGQSSEATHFINQKGRSGSQLIVIERVNYLGFFR